MRQAFTAPTQVDIASLIPGGIKPADQWHINAVDAGCSRCCGPISRYEIPLTLWFGKGDRMLIYCERCSGGQIEALQEFRGSQPTLVIRFPRAAPTF